jgi:lipopolysaccharide transport system permease protein
MSNYASHIWNVRHFWLSLVRMDLRTRYRRSVLGLGWSLLQPLAMTAVLCLVFSQIVGVTVRFYVPHLLTGLVCWNFLVGCALQGCQSFFLGESYIRQCPLPLAIYPLRTSIGAFFHFIMALGVLSVIVAVMRGAASPLAYASFLPSMAIIFAFGWSLAVISGMSNVFFQDTQHLAEVGFQIFFYLTPIIYRMSDVEKHPLAWLLNFNPLVPFMQLIRTPLLDGTPPPLGTYAIAIATTAIAAGLAGTVLRKMQDKLIFHL